MAAAAVAAAPALAVAPVAAGGAAAVGAGGATWGVCWCRPTRNWRRRARRAARRQRGDARAGKTSGTFHWGRSWRRRRSSSGSSGSGSGGKRRRSCTYLQRHFVPPVPSSDACRYKHSINVPGFGYCRGCARCCAAARPSSTSTTRRRVLRADAARRRRLYAAWEEPVRDAPMLLLQKLAANETAAAAAAAAGARSQTRGSPLTTWWVISTPCFAPMARSFARAAAGGGAAAASRGLRARTTEEQLRELFRVRGLPVKVQGGASCAKAPGSDRQVHKRIAEGGYPRHHAAVQPVARAGRRVVPRRALPRRVGLRHAELGCARSST